MQKLLVTGVSGFLGWNICKYISETTTLNSKWSLIGTYLTHSIDIKNCEQIKVDITDKTALEHLFATEKPDAVIHAAAASKPNDCEINKEASYAVNVTASENIAKLCKSAAIPLIFTSTDLVFDGANPPYTESDPVSPICEYGKQKAETEQSILEIYPEALICRMPLMFGDAPPHAPLFFKTLLKALEAKEELKLFHDEFREPISGEVAAEGLMLMLSKMLEAKVNGIVHMGGSQKVSRLDFGTIVAEHFGFEDADIKSVSSKDIKFAAPRSPDVEMDSGLARALGFNPPTLKEQLNSLKYLVKT